MADSEAGSGRSTQEGSLAGRVSGLMWLLVALTTPLALLLPGSDRDPLWVVLTVCALGAAIGLGLPALARSGRSPTRAAHAAMVLMLAAVAALAAATGAHESPAASYLILVVVYAALFHSPAVTLLHVLAAAVVLALPLGLRAGRVQRGRPARAGLRGAGRARRRGRRRRGARAARAHVRRDGAAGAHPARPRRGPVVAAARGDRGRGGPAAAGDLRARLRGGRAAPLGGGGRHRAVRGARRPRHRARHLGRARATT